MRKLSKPEIESAFSLKDRKKVKISVDIDNTDWDNIDFLGWIHPSGHLGYIVYEKGDGDINGIVLSRNKPGGMKNGAMCNLCMTVHGNRGVVLFTAKIASKKDCSQGTYICADLQCSLNVRGLKILSPNQMRETISIDDKIARLQLNLESFLQRIQN